MKIYIFVHFFTDWKCECKPQKFTVNHHKPLTFNRGWCVGLLYSQNLIVWKMLTRQRIVADHFPDSVLFVSSAAIICQITIIPEDSENKYWFCSVVKISTLGNIFHNFYSNFTKNAKKSFMTYFWLRSTFLRQQHCFTMSICLFTSTSR